jgi:phage terminase large subunit-like protein
LGKLKKQTRAERNIAWCERHLRLPDGKFVGQPLKMAQFMKDDFRAIYDNPNGTRRAIISRGRKNAKTTESAMIVCLHLAGPEARRNGQLFSAAQSRDQASILFNLASKMIRMSPDLSSCVTVRDTAKQLYCAELGTLYRALSAEASTAYGLSPVLTIHDELGQVKGPRSQLYDALETATAAQDEPLSIIISTQAPTDADLLSVLIDDAATGADPRTVLRLQSAPEGIDPFSVEAIKAANPAFDVFMNKAEVLAMAEDARRMPSRQSEFENLVCNRRVDASAPFISRTIWTDCAGPVVPDFKGLPVYAGLDLSEVSDLTAFVAVAPVEGVWNVKPTFWLPGVGIAEKSRADRVPYDIWQRDGWLQTTPGKTVDYAFVAQFLWDFCAVNDVRKVAFDRWNWRHLKPWLLQAGFMEYQLEGDAAIFEQFGQGFQSMSPALRDLESAILNKRIAHGGHPVLTMCAANATVQADPAGNRKLSKIKSHGRIDGMVALTMAMSVAGTWAETAGGVTPWDSDPNFVLEF